MKIVRFIWNIVTVLSGIYVAFATLAGLWYLITDIIEIIKERRQK